MTYRVRTIAEVPHWILENTNTGEPVPVVTQFLRYLHTRQYSTATLRAYTYGLRSFWDWLEEQGQDWSTVHQGDVVQYLESTQVPQGRCSGGRLSARTLNHRLAVLNSFFSWRHLVQDDPGSVNPARTMPISRGSSSQGLLGHVRRRTLRQPLRVREDHAFPQAVPIQAVENLISHFHTVRDKAMALLMVMGGLRSMEVRGLQFGDLDLGQGQVRVRGKGRRERWVPLNDLTLTHLHRYILMERPSTSTTTIFVGQKGPHRGDPLSAAGLRSVFRYHRIVSGQVAVRPHRLRHTYATNLAQAGIDPEVLQRLMGHAHFDQTMAYIHLAPEHVRRAYDAAMAQWQHRHESESP